MHTRCQHQWEGMNGMWVGQNGMCMGQNGMCMGQKRMCMLDVSTLWKLNLWPSVVNFLVTLLSAESNFLNKVFVWTYQMVDLCRKTPVVIVLSAHWDHWTPRLWKWYSHSDKQQHEALLDPCYQRKPVIHHYFFVLKRLLQNSPLLILLCPNTRIPHCHKTKKHCWPKLTAPPDLTNPRILVAKNVSLKMKIDLSNNECCVCSFCSS